MSRAARETPAVPPVIVSDLTSLPAVGLTARQFLAFVRAHQVPHAKVGRRVLARLDDLLNALDRLSGRGAPKPAAVPVARAALIESAARGRQ
jgi:hypothetical protein